VKNPFGLSSDIYFSLVLFTSHLDKYWPLSTILSSFYSWGFQTSSDSTNGNTKKVQH